MKFRSLLAGLFILGRIAAQDTGIGSFVSGTILFKDGSVKNGLIRWNTNQNERLQFRPDENGKTEKYGADELQGFKVDTSEYVSLAGIKVCGDDFPMSGKYSVVKQTFGKLIWRGKINVYELFYHGYSGLAGPVVFPSLVFEKQDSAGTQYASFPFAVRMKDKRYEQAKEPLYTFFAASPELTEAIRSFRQEGDVFEWVKIIRSLH